MSSLLYSNPIFKSSEAELRKNHTDFLNASNAFQQQQQQQSSSGLMRYRSAPSSFLLDLVEDNNGSGGNSTTGCEVETVLQRFISSCNGQDEHDDDCSERMHVKRESGDCVSKQNCGYSTSPQMMHQAQQVHSSSSFGLQNSSKIGVGNRSNLVRQSSSPAGFFPNLNVDNGFNMMKDASSFRVGNGTNGEASPSASRPSAQFNISAGSRRLPRIAEIGNGNTEESIEADHSLGNASHVSSSHYIPADFPNDTWASSGVFHELKRGKDNDGKKYSGTTALDTQNVDFGHRNHSLAHHMSLPAHFDMPSMENLLHFQDSVPCKIRAKRGFATHPRSIAERMRRTRISERMKKLQDLFPDMDKQINTADMLELAVEYIKDLQKQVKTLNDSKAKCCCSSKQN